MNCCQGRSEGLVGKGIFYTANGLGDWDHDEVYRQNLALEQTVGTRDEPTCHIFDCIQGTTGEDGPGGGATRVRQAKCGLNKTQLPPEPDLRPAHPKDPGEFTGGPTLVAWNVLGPGAVHTKLGMCSLHLVVPSPTCSRTRHTSHRGLVCEANDVPFTVP